MKPHTILTRNTNVLPKVVLGRCCNKYGILVSVIRTHVGYRRKKTVNLMCG